MTDLIDIRQTERYALYMEKIGWKIGIYKKGDKNIFVFIKKLSPLPFSFIKIHRPFPALDFNDLEKIALKYHAFSIRLHPFISDFPSLQKKSYLQVKMPYPQTKWFFDKKPKNDNSPLIPTKTIWLNLLQKQETLLTDMKQKTRYNIRKFENSKIKYLITTADKINSQELKEIYRLWLANNRKNNLFTPRINELIHLNNSFKENGFYVRAFANNHLAGFVLILTSENMAFYWHNASDSTGRKFFSPTICAWKAIKYSKNIGKTIFDFEGIYDERFPSAFKNWKGFSQFKSGFIKNKNIF